jgi:hypothetical protein
MESATSCVDLVRQQAWTSLNGDLFMVASVIALAFSMATEMSLQAELARFPSFNMAMDMMAFSSAHQVWLETRAQSEIRPNELCNWKDENRFCHDTWSELALCHVGGLSSLVKRCERLKALKEKLGLKDYYDGRMPPPAPIWRFREGPPSPKLHSPPSLHFPSSDPTPA